MIADAINGAILRLYTALKNEAKLDEKAKKKQAEEIVEMCKETRAT